MLRSLTFVLVASLSVAACQKPQGFRGEEVLEVEGEQLLECIASNERPVEDYAVLVRGEEDFLDASKFNVNQTEIGQGTSPCHQLYEVQSVDFEQYSLVMAAYQYQDFGGPRDGNHVIQYFVDRDEAASILRITLEAEKGHDTDMEDLQWNILWLAIPAVEEGHSIQFETEVDYYRNK